MAKIDSIIFGLHFRRFNFKTDLRSDISNDRRTGIETVSVLLARCTSPSSVINLINMQTRTLTNVRCVMSKPDDEPEDKLLGCEPWSKNYFNV